VLFRSPGEQRPLAVWLWSGIWLVYLIIPLAETFGPGYRLWQQIAALVGFWLFGYGYSRLVGRSRVNRDGFVVPRDTDRVTLLLLAGLVALAVVLPFVSSPSWIALWIYVASSCGAALPFEPRRWALLGGVLATAAMVGEAALRGTPLGTWAWLVLPSLFSCFAVIGVRRMRGLIRELHQAREEVKHLAANEERLRLARDLHDLAGHSMATITLKAELARRLMSVDAAAAEKQVADIEQVSRQALADIREAVSGYRRATFAVETASARTALEAARISFEDDPALARRPSGLDPEAEAALAWCLREAVTNVVRHSGATWCRVRLIDARVNGEHTVTLEVTDNGAAVPWTGTANGAAGAGGGAGSGPGPVNGSDASRGAAGHWGNGLTGLRERLAPFCATLTAAPVAPHGFRLAATLKLE